MSKILSGLVIREERTLMFQELFSSLPFKATLAIVQVGDRPDSNSYINQKKIFGEKLGVKIWHLRFTPDMGEERVMEEIKVLNEDKDVQGIIVQVPLPEGWDKKKVINVIDPQKDVDGLTEANQNKFYAGDKTTIVPATARGILTVLDYYKVNLNNIKAVVVGRSELVGKPVAELLRRRGATVEVCHRQTPDIPAVTRTADVLVVATGQPKLIGVDGIKSGQTIIDVGISRTTEGKLSGDVDFENVKNYVEAITPVPGGVGPLTVLSLFENLYQACIAK
ncbi:MAG: bifunctional 5,10-methylenetetrahydrofolate dehydrogenase/5,10-methenyltetrahydrofolate cyclohydrolase [bacterium]